MTTLATHSEPAPQHVEVDEVDTDPEADEYDDDDSEIIDHATFDQLLEMDDEEDREFSKSLVWNYFEQAELTFDKLDGAMSRLDFLELSQLGHFLKGSSAALGLKKIKASCEKLQLYGNCKDAEGTGTITKDEAKDLIQPLLIQMREEYNEAQLYLKALFS